ncbi:hypothetical protein ACROYT_G032556 [Oculina patagonica]
MVIAVSWTDPAIHGQGSMTTEETDVTNLPPAVSQTDPEHGQGSMSTEEDQVPEPDKVRPRVARTNQTKLPPHFHLHSELVYRMNSHPCGSWNYANNKQYANENKNIALQQTPDMASTADNSAAEGRLWTKQSFKHGKTSCGLSKQPSEKLQRSCHRTDIACNMLEHQLHLKHDAVRTVLPEVRQVTNNSKNQNACHKDTVRRSPSWHDTTE